jgi:hypothetical protein
MQVTREQFEILVLLFEDQLATIAIEEVPQ